MFIEYSVQYSRIHILSMHALNIYKPQQKSHKEYVFWQ